MAKRQLRKARSEVAASWREVGEPDIAWWVETAGDTPLADRLFVLQAFAGAFIITLDNLNEIILKVEQQGLSAWMDRHLSRLCWRVPTIASGLAVNPPSTGDPVKWTDHIQGYCNSLVEAAQTLSPSFRAAVCPSLNDALRSLPLALIVHRFVFDVAFGRELEVLEREPLEMFGPNAKRSDTRTLKRLLKVLPESLSAPLQKHVTKLGLFDQHYRNAQRSNSGKRTQRRFATPSALVLWSSLACKHSMTIHGATEILRWPLQALLSKEPSEARLRNDTVRAFEFFGLKIPSLMKP